MTILFAFDRDYTVENPSHMTGPIPLRHLIWLQRETPHEVWAVGNQKLCGEAGIPGIDEMAARMGIPIKKITKHFGNQFDRRTLASLPQAKRKAEKRRINVECKFKRLRILAKLFPDQAHYLVTDDYPEVAEVGEPWMFLESQEFADRWEEVQALALGAIDNLERTVQS